MAFATLGSVQAATLGNLVWIDTNNNGVKDTGESGLTGVLVELVDQNENAVDNPNVANFQAYVAITDASGNYSFTNIPAGTYKLKIATPPGAYGNTSSVTDTADNQEDDDNNGAQTAVGDRVFSPAINLGAAETDSTVDIGLVPSPVLGYNFVSAPVFNWHNGTSGAAWSATDTSKVYTIPYTDSFGNSRNLTVTMTIVDPNNRNGDSNSDLHSAATHPFDPAGGAAPYPGSTEFDNVPGNGSITDPWDSDLDALLTQTNGSYGLNFLTMGIKTANSRERVAFRFTFSMPVRIQNLQIGDIDGAGINNDAATISTYESPGNSFQDRVEFYGRNGSVPVQLTVNSGAFLTANNGTAYYTYNTNINGNLNPDDPLGTTTVSSDYGITQLDIYYSNGTDDAVNERYQPNLYSWWSGTHGETFGVCDDQGVRISGFGLVVADEGSILGTVTRDTDNDDDGDTPIQNVTMTLYSDPNGDGDPSDGAPIDNPNVAGTQNYVVTTSSTGGYVFSGLAAGNYVVVQTQPSGYLTVTDADTIDGADDQPNISTADNLIPVTIVLGESDTGNDFVEEIPPPVGAISGFVYNDTNNDDTGDVGIQGVTLTLLDSAGNPVDGDTVTPGVQPVTTTTAANGSYSFTNLAPGTYGVAETQPGGYLDVLDVDSGDPNKIHPITVTAGNTTTGRNFVEEQPASLSGTVFVDNNNDNVSDGTLENVTITLFTDPNGDGDPSDGTQIGAPVITPANGSYSFTNLTPGKYVVVQTQPAGYLTVTDGDTTTPGDDLANASTTDNRIPVTLLGNESDTGNDFMEELPGAIRGSVLADVDNDNDGDDPIPSVTLTLVDVSGNPVDGNPNTPGVQPMTTTTQPDGSYEFTNLPPGTYGVKETQPSGYLNVSDVDGGDPSEIRPISVVAGQINSGNDFIEELPATISGTVYADANNDNVGDSGIGSVSIALFTDPNGDGDPADGAQVGTTIQTAANGTYSFTNLPPGDYVVVETQPAGYLTVTDGDSTAGADDLSNASTTDNRIPVSVNAGETDTGNDFVEELPGKITGSVLADVDNDNDGDDPIPSVTLTLVETNGDPVDGDPNTPGVQPITTTTQPDGSYEFANVPPGTYGVKETQPSGYLNVSDTDGGDPSEIRPVTVNAGQTNSGNDFIEEEPGSISGSVLADTDNDNDGDDPIPSVTLTLLDSSGNPVDGDPNTAGVQPITTTTQPDGSYEFTNVPPGTYGVKETQPSDFFSVSDTDGGNPDEIRPITVVAGADTPGNDFIEEAPGIIAGKVLNDVDGDGDGDSAIPGTIMTLYTDPNGDGDPVDGVLVGAPITTGADGSYTFPDLEPGSYVVIETQPTGFLTITDGDSIADVPVNPADATNSSTTDNRIAITVAAGETDTGNDFVESVPATLGDYVWNDLNRNGVQDPGEPGIEGVIVTLKDNNGDVVATTTSDGLGRYEFSNLLPGDYSISVPTSLPGGEVLSPQNVGSDTTDSEPDTTTGNSATVTLVPAQNESGMDVGYYSPKASLGNFIWNDLDRDGVQDPGEPGLEGVTVTLLDSTGTAIGSTVTDAYGYYAFTELDPGSYSVQVPATFATFMVLSSANQGGNDALDSDANSTTGITSSVTLVAGENNTTLDIAFNDPRGSIGDLVFNDLDRDGIQDPGEPGIEGVTVTLYDSTGTPVGTTVTDGTGDYVFTGLAPGDYSVGFPPTLPGGVVLSTPDEGGNDNTDSDPDDTTGKTPTISLTAGQTITNIDAGYNSPLGSIGNFVWFDVDRDGLQDASEPGIEGVTVTLYDGAGTPIGTTVTDSSGFYTFPDLAPGDYSVGFPTTVGAGLTPTAEDAGADTADSDIAPGTGMTAEFTLAAGENNTSMDAGYMSPFGSIGDLVFNDLDADGIQDAGEPGIQGITVTLLNSAGIPIGTTTTDASGHYLFADLQPGSYAVQFPTTAGNGSVLSTPDLGGDDSTDTDPNATTGITASIAITPGLNVTNVDAGYNSPLGSIGDFVWSDLNTNGQQDPGEPGIQGVTVTLYDSAGTAIGTTTTDATGKYEFTDLAPGNYSIGFPATLAGGDVLSTADQGSDLTDSDPNVSTGRTATITLAAGADITSIDAGYVPNTASLGNYVWNDVDRDGVQDATESGIQGVIVTLYDSAGAPIGTTTTDASGYYAFTGLPPGTYSVGVAPTVGSLVLSPADQGGNDTLDSDANVTTGRTTSVTLVAGENDSSLDIAFNDPRGSIGDLVFNDLDRDGIQDPGEPGIEGVTVTLYDSTGTPVGSTATDGTGNYVFTGLAPGDYSVGFPTTLPGGVVLSTPDQGGNDITDSDPDETTGKTPTISLTAGQTITNIDAGYNSPLGSIGNFVWFDVDRDGLQDAGEPGIEGVTVTLYDGAGAPIGTTVTDSSGFYTFPDLAPGDYSVGFPTTVGAGLTPTTEDAGADTADSDVAPGTGMTAEFTLAAGENNTSMDAGYISPFGSIGDLVFNDLDADGIQDAGEPGIQGITVTLLNSASIPIGTTTTDASGHYLFADLQPGSYAVQFPTTAGNGSVLSTPDLGGDDNTDTDPNATTGITTSIAITPGLNVTNVDAGYNSPLGSIGDFVWSDLNANGQQDPGEPGVQGVTVTLYDSAGTAIGTTTTDATGHYEFTDLTPGDYAVGFPPTLAGGSALATADVGSNVTNSDPNTSTGRTANVTLGAGQTLSTLDAGYVPNTASIGNFVWNDLDRDGVQDPDEPGIQGITVTLYDSAGDPIGTTTTDATGYYAFTGLVPGTYSVGVAPTSGTLVLSTADQGGNDTLDSDANPTTGKTTTVTLAAGEYNDSFDIAYHDPRASISDLVWLDTDRDGVQDIGEPGIEGVTVTLFDSTGTAIGTTTTDSSGHYAFTDLDPGTYSVGFPTSLTNGNVLTTPLQGGTSSDSNANTTTGSTAPITLAAGEHNTSIDAGFISPLASIGQYVWRDLDRDGVQDVGEPGIEGVTVTLYDSTGTSIGTTTTDATGHFLFPDLQPGTYSLGFPPSLTNQDVLTTADVGADTLDSDPNVTTGRTSTVTLTAGQNYLDYAAGYSSPLGTVGDYVWSDLDADGIQDSNEPGISGVTVNLLNGSGVVIGTTTTDATGHYFFPDLQPGTYAVQFPTVLNGGASKLTTADQGADSADSDANITTGKTANFNLASGQIINTLDAGYVPSLGSIGDRIWLDEDRDGIQDPGEPGIQGVTVTLLDENGAPIGTTTTDASGYYHFTELEPGDYVVQFPLSLPDGTILSQATQGTDGALDSDPNSTTGRTAAITVTSSSTITNIDAGYLAPQASLGDYVWSDLNRNGVQDPGEPGIQGVTVTLLDASGDPIGTTTTDASGFYQFTELEPGDYRLSFPLSLSADKTLTTADQGSDLTDSDANATTGLTPIITLSLGENDSSSDVGYVNPLASIGDFVWNDLDRDGIQDPGEPGLQGITVTLLDGTGTPIGTTTTDASGHYVFTDLEPGTYAVKFPVSLPNGDVLSPTGTGTLSTDSDPVPSTGITSTITLAEGEHNTALDAGYYSPLASIGDFVWRDLDRDGIQDAGEPGIQGVTVTLLDSTGTVIGSTTTDATGFYEFANLQPGTYAVRFPTTLPRDLALSPMDQGNDNADSDASLTTGTSANFTLIAAEQRTNIDAGYQSPLGSIGDFVWQDLDRDGVQDPGEPGIADVTVILYNSAGIPVGTTVTDGTGYYHFAQLDPGTYSLGFPVSLDNDFVLSPADQGSDATDSDPAATNGRTNPIVLTDGQIVTSVDAGYFSPLASLSNAVWNDLDRDGIQDPAEPGIEGVTVTLLNQSGTPIGTTTTDVSGHYAFTDLQPGTYAVQFPATLNQGNLALTQANQGTDSTDSDANASTGITASVTLVAGQNDDSVDAGYLSPLGSIGDRVFADLDRDGIQDPGEPGIEGITITLLDASGTPIGTTVTDGTGAYVFPDLPPGTYAVKFPSTLPNGSVLTTPGQGTDNTLDSDPNATTGVTPPITVGVGQTVTNVDAGFSDPLASIGNFVWLDADRDGIQDPGEPGIANVTVTLYDSTGTAIGTDVTDASGFYSFTSLTPGTYTVGFPTAQGDLVLTDTSLGTQATDSDANPNTGRTAPIILTAGQTNTDMDAGYVSPLASVGDFVWLDLDRDGIQDAGEPGIANVVVTLYNDAGTPIGTTVTDAAGHYLFTDLQPGTYSVGFPTTTTPGYTLGSQDQGTSDATDSDANPSTGRTAPFTLTGGTNLLDLDAAYTSPFASLGDYVWHDLNRDGIQQSGEPGLANVTVTLYDSTGVAIGSDVTDAQGYYSFTGLQPGSYSIGLPLTQPDGLALTTKDSGVNDEADSDVNQTTGRSPLTQLVAGENETSLDAGYVTPFGSIGDRVWRDLDRDGIQDPGEPGISNVRVVLYDSTGTAIGSDVTDGLGYYAFTDLPPGTYTIGFPTELPDGSIPGLADQGTNDALDSDANATTGRTNNIVLTAGQNVMNVDAGYQSPPLSLGSSVWLDEDHNGIQDPGEPGIQGAIVAIFNANGTPARDLDGNLIPPQTTGTDGEYLFTDLAPGDYIVRVTAPAGLEPTIGGVDPDNDNAKDSNGVEMLGEDYVQSLPITLANNSEPVNDGDVDTDTNLTLDFGFFYPKYDLAMRKSLAPTQASPVKAGSKVTYAIEVFNQGDLPVNNISLVDYTPAGLVLDTALSPNWTAQTNGTATGLIINPLLPGKSHQVLITYTVAASAEGLTLHNFAEVTGAKDPDGHVVTDVDSTPDSNPTNDGLVTNDEIHNANGDEDDHDQSDVVVSPAGTWDLALRKSLAATQAHSVNAGDTVLFNVEVFNQGTEPAHNVRVVDYIPAQMTLADLRWTAATGNTATALLNQPLQPGTSVTLPIFLKVNTNAVGPLNLTNYAEVQSFQDKDGNTRPDADSVADNSPTNDGPSIDDAINNEDSDQDDHDGSTFTVNPPAVFDLALRKKVKEGSSSIVPRNGLVTYDFEVFNQGSIPAHNIVVTDYLPSSLTLEDDNWFSTLPGQVATTIFGPVNPGQSVTISLTARLSSSATANATITNRSEISAAYKPDGTIATDHDSVFDNNPTNDGLAINDAINNENGDQDDSDIAAITVQPPGTFDLALRKTTASGQNITANAGDLVTYMIEVFNQGSVTARNIEVIDYIPAGMALEDPAWMDLGSGKASTTLASIQPLTPGSSVQIPIKLRISTSATAGPVSNMAEIKSAKDNENNIATDIDSLLDNNPNNDGLVRDDEIHNGGFDEDDSDISTITINPPARRDLALRKTLAPGQDYNIKPGTNVRYCMEIFNQGAVAAKDIVVCDYLPPGTTLAPVTENRGWQRTPTAGVWQCPVTGPLQPGATHKVYITVKMPTFGPQELTNDAEICSAKNLDGTPFIDDDSTADNDPENDGKATDDAIAGENFDQDDHDISNVNVLAPDASDLALRKTLATGQKSCIDEGQPVTYKIEVFNQGQLALKDIKVCDYKPSGLDLVSADWTPESSTMVSCTIAGPLEPGKSASIYIAFKAKPGSADTIQKNCAEICEAKLMDGTLYVDRDSTPDSNPANDGRMENDAINNEAFDQDDSDCEDIKINPPAPRGSIGDYVWMDSNGNGVQDPGETPFQGVVVKLLNASGTVLKETLTDLAGQYLFSDLPAGSYMLEFVQPAGVNRSTKDFGADDAKDSDADPLTGRTAIIALSDGQNVTNVDAGFSPQKSNWQSFLANDPATGNSATADTDNDGYTSIAEFAFCLKPGSGVMDKCPITIKTTADGKLQVCVRRIEGGNGLTISLEKLTDLSASPAGWSAILSGPSSTVSNGDGTATACWNDIESLTGIANGQGFVRAVVSLDTDGDTQANFTTHSATVGWTRRTFLNQCETFSMPYLKCDIFRGSVSGISASGIDVINGGQSVSGAMLGGRSYYVEIISGPHEGHRFEVNESASTAGSIAVQLGGRSTHTSIPGDLIGARIAVREHCVVNEVLSPAVFRGNTNPTASDRLMFWTGSGYDILWNAQTSSIDRWVTSSDATLADLGTRVLAPCEGLFVHPRLGSVSVVVSGIVRTNAVRCPLPVGSSFLGGGWPLDQSPSSRAMSVDTGFTGAASPTNADKIRIWLGDSTFGREGYGNYFLLNSTTRKFWTPEGDASLSNQNDVNLLGSTRAAFMFMKLPNPSYVEPLPWTP